MIENIFAQRGLRASTRDELFAGSLAPSPTIQILIFSNCAQPYPSGGLPEKEPTVSARLMTAPTPWPKRIAERLKTPDVLFSLKSGNILTYLAAVLPLARQYTGPALIPTEIVLPDCFVSPGLSMQSYLSRLEDANSTFAFGSEFSRRGKRM